ncbi:hypothetical protein [Paraburkholderia sp. J63]|uniref:hypothetical protein n=1 Tax=Paraburkholderia sp. J63 TaxID=2805434 RepID=UPI002ABE25C6|nr:hypothetical protein [Paraburkholderia sp. J63]
MSLAIQSEGNDQEKPMAPHPLRVWPRVALVFAIPAAIVTSAATSALAQSGTPHPPSPMAVPPPAAASGTASATNPDNMPVKKPRKPPNDDIARPPPASAAKAK